MNDFFHFSKDWHDAVGPVPLREQVFCFDVSRRGKFWLGSSQEKRSIAENDNILATYKSKLVWDTKETLKIVRSSSSSSSTYVDEGSKDLDRDFKRWMCLLLALDVHISFEGLESVSSTRSSTN